MERIRLKFISIDLSQCRHFNPSEISLPLNPTEIRLIAPKVNNNPDQYREQAVTVVVFHDFLGGSLLKNEHRTDDMGHGMVTGGKGGDFTPETTQKATRGT